MRSRIFVAGLAFASGLATAAAAQPSQARSGATADNAAYVEGGGAGLFYSLNYERRFGDCAARVGFGYLALGSRTSSSSTTAAHSDTDSFFAVPFTVSYLGVGSAQNMLELGAGAALYHRGSGAFGGGIDPATALVPTVLAGYRHQPAGAGFLFRIGLSVLVETDRRFDLPEPILPWPYLALGGAFG